MPRFRFDGSNPSPTTTFNPLGEVRSIPLWLDRLWNALRRHARPRTMSGRPAAQRLGSTPSLEPIGQSPSIKKTSLQLASAPVQKLRRKYVAFNSDQHAVVAGNLTPRKSGRIAGKIAGSQTSGVVTWAKFESSWPAPGSRGLPTNAAPRLLFCRASLRWPAPRRWRDQALHSIG